MDALFSNTQVWTILLSGITAFIGSVSPILVARYQARQEADRQRVELRKATADVELSASKAKDAAKLASQKAADDAKASARRDAIDEWQKLYGEREKEVTDLKDHVASLQDQNADQQNQLNNLKYQHQACEQGRLDDKVVAQKVHADLSARIEDLKGKVTIIANGENCGTQQA